jgi:hypothetical protein
VDKIGENADSIGISIVGEVLISKPTMLFNPPAPETVITDGPGSITHASAHDHFLSWGLMFVVMLFTAFDFLALRKLRDIPPLLLLALMSVVTIPLSAA